MPKILILTSQKRVQKFYDLSTLPPDFELIWGEAAQTDEEVLALCGDADVIFADAIRPVGKNLIEKMPNLKLIHSEGVGYNAIDTIAARKRNVFVCNNAAANAAAVAEHAVMLMLGLQRNLLKGDAMVRAGKQIEAKGAMLLEGVHELGPCRVGLIGFGSIAQATAKLLDAFGCGICYYSRSEHPNEAKQYNAEFLPLNELLSSCDIVSLHVPATEETFGMINRDRLSLMKPNALLINTARGEVVVQEDLAQTLIDGTIAGAGLDTLFPEPVRDDNPLLHLPQECAYRILFSPHIAGATAEALQAMHHSVWNNILAVTQNKRPVNIVNGR